MFTHRKQLPLKPATQLAVDYSHWLAPYLSCCYMQNELGPTAKMVDLTLHANHGAPTGTTMQVGSYGRERIFASGNLVAVPYGPQLDSTTIWPGAHIRATIILARVKSTGGATSNQVICCRKYDSISNIPYFLGIGGINAANGVGHYTGGFSSTGITTDIRADNTYHVVCGVLVDTPGLGAYTGFYYVDGVRDKYSLLGSFPNPKTLALNIGADYNNTNSFIGSIESLQIFVGVPIPDIGNSTPTPANHAMFLDGLIADLSRNPYQLLTASRLTTSFLPASNITLALTGNGSTSAVGTPGVEFDLSQTGNSSTSSVGNLTPTQGLSGASSTTAVNAFGVEFDLSQTGNSSTSSVGSATPTQGLSGVSSATAVNAPGVEFDLAQTGNASTSQVGNVAYSDTISGQADALGNASTGASGTVAPALSLALTGVSSATAVGDVTPTQGLTGVSSATAVGSVTVQSSDITLALTGVAATAAAGTVAYGAALAATGVSSTTGLGSTGVGIALGMSGNAGTTSTGTIVSGTSLAAQGIATTGAVGSAAAAFQLWLANVVAASSVGGVTPTQGLAGSASATAVGSLGVQYASALTGTGAIGSTGTLGTAPISTGRHQVFVVQLPVEIDVVLAPQSRMFTVFGDSVVSIQRQDAVQTIVT